MFAEGIESATSSVSSPSAPVALPPAVAPSFYINLTLLNKDEIITSKIQQKTG
jgi:hypothetical protein